MGYKNASWVVALGDFLAWLTLAQIKGGGGEPTLTVATASLWLLIHVQLKWKRAGKVAKESDGQPSPNLR